MAAHQHAMNSWNAISRAAIAAPAARIGQILIVLAVGFPPICARAAITWDGGGDSNFWFDYHNWTEDGAMLLPPGQDEDNLPETTADVTVGDAIINNTAALSDGAVVYDPSSGDPFFAGAASLFFPTGFNRQTIYRLFLGNNDAGDTNPTDATLIIRGDLTTNTVSDTRWQIGRTSGTAPVIGQPYTAITGTIIQEKGIVRNNNGDVDLGSIQTSIPLSYGNGTYDYRSGTFEQGMTQGRLRLQAGGSSATGGVGKWIMHNPGTDTLNGGGGYVRVNELLVASHGGQNGIEPDGISTGIGVVEFHYQNGATRPFQINSNLTLNNGGDAGADTGIRSSRLRLVLDEAPIIDVDGKPNDLGLFDVDSDGNGTGNIIGPGAGPGEFGLTLSNADAPNPLASSAVYDNLVDTVNLPDDDNIVTAMFGASTYRWRIHYDGNILWAPSGGRDNSILDLTMGGGDGIDGPGTGRDIVLIGLDSMIVEGLPGDFNGDGLVTAADYTTWRDNLGNPSEAVLNDNGDGLNGVDNGDYTLWKNNFGAPGSGGVAAGAVPEPGTLLLVVCGAIGLVGVRRRAA